MGLGRAGCGEATTPIRLTQLITTGTGFLVPLFCMHSFEVIPSNVGPTWLIRLKKIFCWPIVRNATFEVWQKKVSKDMNYLYFQLPYQVQSPAEASLPYQAVDLTPNLQLMPRSRLTLKLRLRPSLRRKPRLGQRPILRHGGSWGLSCFVLGDVCKDVAPGPATKTSFYCLIYAFKASLAHG